MDKMNMNLKIVQSQNQIGKGILAAFLQDLKKDIDRGVSLIKNQLPQIINSAVINSPEYSSLVGGRLKYDFGIPNASQKISGLIDIWSQNIQYRYKAPFIAGTQIRSSFSASMFKVDFSDVLGTDYASVYDTVRGYSLPWLQWLVFYGNIPIIDDYQVVMVNTSASRTGRAIMRKSGGSWRVPSEFSGTMADNWITRAIESKSAEINLLLERSFK